MSPFQKTQNKPSEEAFRTQRRCSWRWLRKTSISPGLVPWYW